MTAGFDSNTGRVARELTRGVPLREQWFSQRAFREVIGPRAADMISDGRHSADVVKDALVQVLVPAARREARRRSVRGPLRDHPVEFEEILLTRVWQAVQNWDGVRVDGLCSLLGAQVKFGALDAAREASDASKRTRVYGGRFQELEDRLVQQLGRKLTMAERRDAARQVLPERARPGRVDEIIKPVRTVGLSTSANPGPGQVHESDPALTRVGAGGESPEADVVSRFVGDTVRAWLDRVPEEASTLYRKWLARDRADALDPPAYVVRPLLPYVAELLDALGDDPLVNM